MTRETATIETLGRQGDGIADTPSGPVYVPFALPGETVTIDRSKTRGDLVSIDEPAANRVEPPCPHFGPGGRGGACGGCSLQHIATPDYADWKRGLVVAALASAGIAAEVAPLFACSPGQRRRMVLTARRTEKTMLLGFNQAGSHHIVAIETCAVSDRRIVSQLSALRRIAAAICATGNAFRLTVLASDTGFDVAAEGSGKLSPRQRQVAVETALGEKSLARLAVDGEILIEKRKPVIKFGTIAASPPPGGFVQAGIAAEARMCELATAHLDGCKQAADLFSGCGTFALRLAQKMKVHAAESDATALASLDAAFRSASGLKPVKTDRRDLFRRPMMAAELKGFDAALFDPPRAGAEQQSRELAQSGVKRIVAISCNPVTLARDCALLAEGGFRIDAVHPIDQFLWSPHVEAVALLTR